MILRAAQEVVSEPDFDSMLDQTRDRVDEIEGECTVKHARTGQGAVLWRYIECEARGTTLGNVPGKLDPGSGGTLASPCCDALCHFVHPVGLSDGPLLGSVLH